MKTIFEHIEYAKQKPHHVRKRITFALAAGTSILIAFVWLASSVSSGSFAIQGSTFADDTGQGSSTAAVAESATADTDGVAGVASALSPAQEPEHIEIISTATSTATKGSSDQTTIPF